MKTVKLLLLFTVAALILTACTKKEVLPTSLEASSKLASSAASISSATLPEIETSSKVSESSIVAEPHSSLAEVSSSSEFGTSQIIQSSSSEVQPEEEQNSIIKITSTQSKSVNWSTNDKDIADDLISLLMQYDEVSPTLDIKVNDFIIVTNIDENKKNITFG